MAATPTATKPLLEVSRMAIILRSWGSLLALGLMVSGCSEPRARLPDPAADLAPVQAPEVHTVWVQITRKVDEKGSNYTYGRMLASDLKRMTQSAQLPALVCVHDCHWYGDHGLILLESDLNSGVYYLRIDNLTSIQEQKPKDIVKLREEEREADRQKQEAERKENEKTELSTP